MSLMRKTERVHLQLAAHGFVACGPGAMLPARSKSRIATETTCAKCRRTLVWQNIAGLQSPAWGVAPPLAAAEAEARPQTHLTLADIRRIGGHSAWEVPLLTVLNRSEVRPTAALRITLGRVVLRQLQRAYDAGQRDAREHLAKAIQKAIKR